MAMVPSVSAMRMGLRTRTPMVVRRAIRCGVRTRPSGSPFFSGRSRDKFFSRQSTKNRGVPITGTPRFFFAGKISVEYPLLANHGHFGVGNFQPHQPVMVIEQNKNLQVGSADFEAFVGFALGTGGSSRFDGDRTRRQFLRNDHRKSLHPALGPVVDARKDRVLMVEIVVQNGDER